MSAPAPTARLFSDPSLDTLLASGEWDPIIRRLLEDGDHRDLRWLSAVLGEGPLHAWFERRGAKRLSSRSRAFWALVLGRADSVAQEEKPAVWPY